GSPSPERVLEARRALRALLALALFLGLRRLVFRRGPGLAIALGFGGSGALTPRLLLLEVQLLLPPARRFLLLCLLRCGILLRLPRGGLLLGAPARFLLRRHPLGFLAHCLQTERFFLTRLL